MYRFNKMKCINCGHIGHSYKVCREPKTSYGILAIKLVDNKNRDCDKITQLVSSYLKNITEIQNRQYVTCNDEESLKKFTFTKEIVKILLIMRKHTLGYMEFIRGHYSVNNTGQLAYLFEQMTPYEIESIKSNYNNFELLWKNMWSSNSIYEQMHDTTNYQLTPETSEHMSEQNKEKHKKCYDSHFEFENSKSSFTKLRDDAIIKLADFVNTTKPLYSFPEWGIPKGRRAGCESDIECAKREFTEETGYSDEDYELFDNIKPLVENITGSNGVKYRHIYYIAMLKSDKQPSCDNLKKAQLCEIGDINLFDLDDSLRKIRPHHVERQRIIYTVCINIVNTIMSIL